MSPDCNAYRLRLAAFSGRLEAELVFDDFAEKVLQFGAHSGFKLPGLIRRFAPWGVFVGYLVFARAHGGRV